MEDPDWMSALSSGRLKEYQDQLSQEQFRLLLVSPEGRRVSNSEFEWEMTTRVYPDTAGQYLALVLANESRYPSEVTEPINTNLIYAVADDLSLVSKTVIEGNSGHMDNFRAYKDRFYWIDSNFNFDIEVLTTSETVYCASRSGKILWEYVIPDAGDKQQGLGALNELSIDEEGNLFIATAGQSVMSLDKDGNLLWNAPLDVGFNQHPLKMPDDSLVLVGNRSHEIEIPEFEQLDLDFLDMDSSEWESTDFEAASSKWRESWEGYVRKLQRQPGQLLMLSMQGEVITSVKLPSQPQSGPVVLDGNRILVAVADFQGKRLTGGIYEVVCPSRIMCFELSGNLLWDRKIDDYISTDFLKVIKTGSGADPQIVLAGIRGRLYSLSPEGELLWTITDSQFDSTTLAVREDGSLLIVSDGDLICYELPDAGASGN
jgi:hypothetical protein